MKKTFVRGKKLFIILGGILLFLAIAFWVFTSFFLDDILTGVAPGKLNAIVRVVTHGRFVVRLGKITYRHGDIICQKFEFARLRYDTSEHSMTLKKISADTIRVTGVSLWDLAWGNDLSMKSMEVNAPKFILTDAGKEEHSPDVIKDSIKLPAAAFDSIVLNDVIIKLPELFHPHEKASWKGMRLKLSGFFFNPESLEGAPLLYSKQVDFVLSEANYLSADSMYVMQLRNLRASVSDSLLVIDSFSYRPNYSEDDFAKMNRYQIAAIRLNCTKMRVEGINVRKLSVADGLEFRKFETGSWSLDSYLDRRRPENPHYPPVQLPNELLLSVPMAIHADSIIFRNGKLTVRERSPGSLQAGMLFFDRTHIAISGVSADPDNPIQGKPAHIALSAYFLGEALLRSNWIYPLDQTSFDLHIHATLGSFHANKLNTWLVPFERIEVSDGVLDSGKIEMNIRSGISTTTVTPYYRNLSMKVLPADVHKNSGLMEGFKSLWAKVFVLRSNNTGESVKSGTTSRKRTSDQDLMQFIWISLRKSLGQVVGGFQ